MSFSRLIAGVMSGTSADGVDVALVRIDGRGCDMSPRLLVHHSRPYTPVLRRRIFEARSGRPLLLRDLADLARQISLVYAAAVNEALVSAGLTAADLSAVAAHGQTLFHDPPATLQWLDPALLAAEVGAPVVSDFRRADCAVGGQGAPLVPFADFLLFRHPSRSRVLVNIGGIANLTHLPAAARLDEVRAFDTGPGNCISDWLCRQFEPGGPGFDLEGRRACRGQVSRPDVQRFLDAPYCAQSPPKSTDGPAMIELFASRCADALSRSGLDDLLATACAITAESIAGAIARFLPGRVDEVIASGGGIRNQAIARPLRDKLGGAVLLTSDDLGIRSESKEALAFALLGAATLDQVPANIPTATGARRPVVLGTVTPRP